MTATIRGRLISLPVRTETREGRVSCKFFLEFEEDGRAYTASVYATDPLVCRRLLALTPGDKVVLRGHAAPRTWTASRDHEIHGIGITASALEVQS